MKQAEQVLPEKRKPLLPTALLWQAQPVIPQTLKSKLVNSRCQQPAVSRILQSTSSFQVQTALAAVKGTEEGVHLSSVKYTRSLMRFSLKSLVIPNFSA